MINEHIEEVFECAEDFDRFYSHIKHVDSDVAEILHFALYNTNKLITITTDRISKSQDFLTDIISAYYDLPSFFRFITIESDSKRKTEFSNGTAILIVTANKNAFRGYSINFAYIDSTGIPCDILDEIEECIVPVLSACKAEFMVR